MFGFSVADLISCPIQDNRKYNSWAVYVHVISDVKEIIREPSGKQGR
jgi:hypothetical protein